MKKRFDIVWTSRYISVYLRKDWNLSFFGRKKRNSAGNRIPFLKIETFNINPGKIENLLKISDLH